MPTRNRPPSTIRDVAALAGVSPATVSRVMNASGPVSTGAADAVRSAVAALGFHPSPLGRRLRSARTQTLGLLLPSFAGFEAGELADGISTAARAAGYAILIATSDHRAEREAEALGFLLGNRVEGLILTVADADANAALDDLDSRGIRYVLLGNRPGDPDRPAVSVDMVAAAQQAAAHLDALGHRRIAMVTGDARETDRSRLLLSGFRAACPAGSVIELPGGTADLVGRLTPLLTGRDAPTALFCATDMLAIAACRVARKIGRVVPRDLGVLGFGGDPAGALAEPSLATLVPPTGAMASAAVALLLERIAGGAKRCIALPPALRPGGSLGPPPQPGAAHHTPAASPSVA